MARRAQPPIIKKTIPHVIGDVLIHAMNKAQLLPLAIAAVLVIISIRMPQDELSELLETIIRWQTGVCISGYAVALFVLFLWLAHIRFMRRMHQSEIGRLAEERTFWQEQATGVRMNSVGNCRHDGLEGDSK